MDGFLELVGLYSKRVRCGLQFSISLYKITEEAPTHANFYTR